MAPRVNPGGYTCGSCSRWFDKPGKLTAHREKVHGITPPRDPAEPQEEPADA